MHSRSAGRHGALIGTAEIQDAGSSRRRRGRGAPGPPPRDPPSSAGTRNGAATVGDGRRLLAQLDTAVPHAPCLAKGVKTCGHTKPPTQMFTAASLVPALKPPRRPSVGGRVDFGASDGQSSAKKKCATKPQNDAEGP